MSWWTLCQSIRVNSSIACKLRKVEKYSPSDTASHAGTVGSQRCNCEYLKLKRRAGLWYPSSRVQTRPKPSDFSGRKKFLSTPSFGREVKPFVPCRIFAACKRTRKCIRGSRSFLSKLPAFSFLLSLLGSLAVQVERLKTRVCTISLRLQCIQGH